MDLHNDWPITCLTLLGPALQSIQEDSALVITSRLSRTAHFFDFYHWYAASTDKALSRGHVLQHRLREAAQAHVVLASKDVSTWQGIGDQREKTC